MNDKVVVQDFRPTVTGDERRRYPDGFVPVRVVLALNKRALMKSMLAVQAGEVDYDGLVVTSADIAALDSGRPVAARIIKAMYSIAPWDMAALRVGGDPEPAVDPQVLMKSRAERAERTHGGQEYESLTLIVTEQLTKSERALPQNAMVARMEEQVVLPFGEKEELRRRLFTALRSGDLPVADHDIVSLDSGRLRKSAFIAMYPDAALVPLGETEPEEGGLFT